MLFKLQACVYKENKDQSFKYGFAKVSDFGCNDVDWIINEKGNKIPKVYDYFLLQLTPGYLAQVDLEN